MAKEIDILKFTTDDLTTEKLAELIGGKRSFEVVTVRDISTVVHKIESEIEKQDLRCRVYTEYRSASMGGMIIPTGVTQLAGVASAVGIGLHNLVTINPDYEISKNAITSTVKAIYQK